MNQPINQNQQVTRRDVIGNSLSTIRNQINSLMLKDKAKADKFLAAALVVATDKTLERCSPDSITQSLLSIAMLDLSVDKNIGHAYILPYNTSKKVNGQWEKKAEAQFQLGYKGWIQLLFRAGWAVKAHPVYFCDEFNIKFRGFDNEILFDPAIDEREEGDRNWVYENLRGVYVIARHADSKDEYSTFINKKLIEKLRLVSPNQKINDFTKPEEKARLEAGLPTGVWHDWYAEMACAKAVKKLAKTLPVGDKRLQTLMAVDDLAEIGKKVDQAKSIEGEFVIEVNEPEESHPEAKPASNITEKLNKKQEEAVDSTSTLITPLSETLAAIDLIIDSKTAESAKELIEKLSNVNERASAMTEFNKKVKAVKDAKKASEKTAKADAKKEPDQNQVLNWMAAIDGCGSIDEIETLKASIPDDVLDQLETVIEKKIMSFPVDGDDGWGAE